MTDRFTNMESSTQFEWINLASPFGIFLTQRHSQIVFLSSNLSQNRWVRRVFAWTPLCATRAGRPRSTWESKCQAFLPIHTFGQLVDACCRCFPVGSFPPTCGHKVELKVRWNETIFVMWNCFIGTGGFGCSFKTVFRVSVCALGS